MNARKKKPEPAPKFRTEDEEREFWAERDVVDFFDWDDSVRGWFPALRPSTTT